MVDTSQSPTVHDLLLLNPYEVEAATGADGDSIRIALRNCPWVVVRRAPATDGKVSIGIRGTDRQHQWGAFARLDQIVQLIVPRSLRSHLIAGDRGALNAMRSLRFVENQLSSISLEWGPGGSVGYELVSGRSVVHQTSDLDLVIRAPERFDQIFAKELLAILLLAPAKVDCRVETPWCGFSLEEYARSNAPQLLVRTPAGPILSEDPWAASSTRNLL